MRSPIGVFVSVACVICSNALPANYFIAQGATAKQQAAAPAPGSGGPESGKSLKQKFLQSLSDGAGKLKSYFNFIAHSTAIDSLPVIGGFGKEYDAMSTWWCSDKGREVALKSGHPATGLCARIALSKKLSGLPAAEKKKQLEALLKADRKGEMEEAKRMVQHFCRTSQGERLQMCVRSIGILESAKHVLWQRQQNTTKSPIKSGR